MSLSRLLTRTRAIYRQGGLNGVVRQAWVKLSHIYDMKTFRPHVVDRTVAGHELRVCINNQFARVYETQLEWPEITWLAMHLIRRGDRIIDCGANNGFTTTFFAKCAGPEGHVLAVEPLPSNARDILQNIALNRLSNVTLIQKAAGDHNGIARMIDTPNGVLTACDSDRAITVSMIRLDDACGDWLPTVIKVDVEGHELEVLRGAARLLASRPRLDVEVHPIYHCDRLAHATAVVAFLDRYNYEYFVQPGVNAAIVPWDRSLLPLARLALCDTFHLFCSAAKYESAAPMPATKGTA